MPLFHVKECENPKCKMHFRARHDESPCPFCGATTANPNPAASQPRDLPPRAPVEGYEHDEAES